jgi:hypothetical protein
MTSLCEKGGEFSGIMKAANAVSNSVTTNVSRNILYLEIASL